MRKLLMIAVVGLVTASPASAATWKPVAVAAKLKATWTTVDPKAVAEIQEHIDALIAAGSSSNDPMIVALRGDLKKAQHAATVASATCVGVGKGHGRYARFHCTAKVAAHERTPPDNQFYAATVKLTVTTANGFVVKAGWR